MNDELRMQRQERILGAMQGEKIDRTPLMWAGDLALIRYAKPQTDFQYMIEHHEDMTKTIVDEVLPKFPKLDFLAAVGMSSRFLGAAFLVKTLLPGVDIPADEMWQLDFDHAFTEDVYDEIIEGGWQKFSDKILFDKLGYDPEAMGKDFEAGLRNKQLYHDAGLPFFRHEGMLSSPYDVLAFGRGLTEFFMDMYEQPDEMKAAMNVIMEEEEARIGNSIKEQVADAEAHGEVVMYTIAPCVQANCDLLGRAQFEEFGWPLIERQTNFILDQGAYVRFHMDSNWTNNLDLFAQLPAGRCIFDSDGNTDLIKTRDILGPKMAFTGTVDPANFAFGKPEQIYDEVKEQLAVMGDSFIASPSCSIPANAPAENIDAMYAAIDEL